MNMVICHAQKMRTKSRACIVPPQKKKVIVEMTDSTKPRKLFKRPHREMSKVRNHNSRIVEPTERDCFVKRGIHIAANSGAEVGFHLGATTGYASTAIVVYQGSRPTAPLARDYQQFIDRDKLQMRGEDYGS